MPKRPPDEEIFRAMEIIQKLLTKIEPAARREAVLRMMTGSVGAEYFSAPASSREDFHSCFPGGLAYHSLNVLKYLRAISESLAPGRYTDSTLILVALFHDLGKVGDGEEPFYVPNPSDWHRSKGMLYETNRKCVFMPTSERGLFILQRHGIELAPDEYLAIRLNDGMYDETNRKYAMKEPELALLLHFADRWASEQEKREAGD